jgi:BirA family biotin operon repressor/biotin-[acetyl-CoA-carboxylase] ligase
VTQSVRSIVLEEVGSTNTEAFKRAEAGERGPLWIVARRQTQGRGRSGRSWGSEPGNLYASLLQRLSCPPSAVHQISLLAGVAVIDAIRAASGGVHIGGLRLKWPNDVLIGQAKCAGILPECVSGANGKDITAVIGIGINLAWHPADIGRPATHLAAHGVDVTPDAMLRALASAMQDWIGTWQGGAGFARVRAAWLERAGPVGEAATVDTGAERIAGTFLGLDGDGALLLRDAHGLQRKVTYGDVTLAEPITEGRG